MCSSGWWTRTIGHVSLLGATIVVLLGIGIAYMMQSNRARAADEVCEKVRDRIDSALNRGRCGLWDWDIGTRADLLVRFHVRASRLRARRTSSSPSAKSTRMIHPEDQDLFTLAEQLASASTSLVDYEFRIRSISGDWVWLRARAELMNDPTTRRAISSASRWT